MLAWPSCDCGAGSLTWVCPAAAGSRASVSPPQAAGGPAYSSRLPVLLSSSWGSETPGRRLPDQLGVLAETRPGQSFPTCRREEKQSKGRAGWRDGRGRENKQHVSTTAASTLHG